MAYLHDRNILHRDLKTANLLVSSEWKVKVGDFGLSRLLENSAGEAQTLTACGTPAYAAPEVLSKQKYSHSADVYGFGVCLWEMLHRKIPYQGLSPYQAAFAILKGEVPPISPKTPPEFVQLMQDCWQQVPDDRPTFLEILDTLEDIHCPTPNSPFPQIRTGPIEKPNASSPQPSVSNHHSKSSSSTLSQTKEDVRRGMQEYVSIGINNSEEDDEENENAPLKGRQKQ